MEWVLCAHMWLRENNRLCRDTDPPEVGAPTVINNSEIVESENTDIETVEEMRVVFPDGTVKTGGLDDGQKFDHAVTEIRSKCASSTPPPEFTPFKAIVERL